MGEKNVYLVRSPKALIKHGLAGYGWPQVNFSNYSSSHALIEEFTRQDINVGRRTRQIKRFFAISKGDIVVIPLHKAVAIGYATGEKSYAQGVNYGENRIGVRYLRHEDGTLVHIPRDQLVGALSAKLRIQTAIASLNDFRNEIIEKIGELEKGENGVSTLASRMQALEEEQRQALKTELLANIQHGKTYLSSGGRGLERLVEELFQTEGYTTIRFATTAHPGRSDADIEAIRVDRFMHHRLLVQVKHHRDDTGFHAVKQLAALNVEDDAQRWVITTGNISQNIKDKADAEDVQLMPGEELVDWLIDQLPLLSRQTRNQLGLSSLPSLLL